MSHEVSLRANPSTRIVVTAIAVGSISLVLGFGTPGNLGPLFGIFLTGPIGTLAGALIGLVWSACRAGERIIRVELWWLGCLWGLSLIYLYAMLNRFGPFFEYVVIAFQGAVIASAAFLLFSRRTRRNLPKSIRKNGPVLLCAAVLIVLTSMFPPVTQPWWVPEHAMSSEPLPKFAFMTDNRFDASQHYPEFAVAAGELAREWLIIAGATGAVCIFIGMRRRRKVQLSK